MTIHAAPVIATSRCDEPPLRTFHLKFSYATGEPMGEQDAVAETPYQALCLCVENCISARGYADLERGIVWPFNPNTTIDGVSAVEVFDAHHGTNYAGVRPDMGLAA